MEVILRDFVLADGSAAISTHNKMESFASGNSAGLCWIGRVLLVVVGLMLEDVVFSVVDDALMVEDVDLLVVEDALMFEDVELLVVDVALVLEENLLVADKVLLVVLIVDFVIEGLVEDVVDDAVVDPCCPDPSLE